MVIFARGVLINMELPQSKTRVLMGLGGCILLVLAGTCLLALGSILNPQIGLRLRNIPALPPVEVQNTMPTSLPANRPGIASGPLRISDKNPRYFMDGSGKTILLTGSHTWLNLQDGVRPDPPPAFDYNAYLDYLAAHNHNFFRLWAWEQTKWSTESKDDYFFTPHPYLRTGPGTGLDGKPKFDLNQFNQAYFDRVRERVIQARDRGFYVSVMLFNGWSISNKGGFASEQPWKGHPYNASNNINGINGDLDGNGQGEEIETLRVPAVLAYQEAYVRKVIDTVNDLDNVLYEISNEGPSNSEVWQYHMIQLIKDYENSKPNQHPVGMTVEYPEGNNHDLIESPADWISLNGDINNPPAADGNKVILADTDHLCGICGDRFWVWKSFTRGENPIFMDQYDDSYKLNGGGYDMNNPNDVSLRKNLGYVRSFSTRLILENTTPHGNLASTGYCLANPVQTGAEYIIYSPTGGRITIDLSGTTGELFGEWFNPATGELFTEIRVTGGKVLSFEPPFDGDAVLYIYQKQVSSRNYLPLVSRYQFRPQLYPFKVYVYGKR